MLMAPFCFGFASPSHVTTQFLSGVIDLLGGPIAKFVRGVIPCQSGPDLASARDYITRRFLETDAPILVMVDTDMAFSANHVAAVVGLTRTAGVVGAHYLGLMFSDAAPHIEAARLTASGALEDLASLEESSELVDVDAVGAGLIAIRREVLEDVGRLPYGEPLPWWANSVRGGSPVAEDWEFCLRAREAGHRVAVAPAVRVQHMKLLAV